MTFYIQNVQRWTSLRHPIVAITVESGEVFDELPMNLQWPVCMYMCVCVYVYLYKIFACSEFSGQQIHSTVIFNPVEQSLVALEDEEDSELKGPVVRADCHSDCCLWWWQLDTDFKKGYLLPVDWQTLLSLQQRGDGVPHQTDEVCRRGTDCLLHVYTLQVINTVCRGTWLEHFEWQCDILLITLILLGQVSREGGLLRRNADHRLHSSPCSWSHVCQCFFFSSSFPQ